MVTVTALPGEPSSTEPWGGGRRHLQMAMTFPIWAAALQSAFQQPVYRYSIRRSHSGAEANNGASKAK
nr:hypothetical protein [Pseudomonas aeruginosa]